MPVLAAVFVIVEVMPLATPTETAGSAAALAARLPLKMIVVESRIWAIVVPKGIPTPEMRWPTTKLPVVPEAKVTVVVAVPPVAARLRVAAVP